MLTKKCVLVSVNALWYHEAGRKGNPMTQTERRRYLIDALLAEAPEYQRLTVPEGATEQRQLLRSLMNVRPPRAIDPQFLQIQDAYLETAIAEKGITDYHDLEPLEKGIYLWRGDIATQRCGAIVNAANSGMTGCYQPCHNCIDNCIHTFAGIQLRQACGAIMEAQGTPEPTGQAKLTKAYNLPCDYVLHTVGPIVQGRLRPEHETLLASCYNACMRTAEQAGIRSVAFCCISTGVFGFPKDRAAEIAVETVRAFQSHSNLEVIFNVFEESDEIRYRRLLGTH